MVKILRSPHANAIVQEINTKAAKLVPGVVDIYTWEDVPKNRFAIAGQTFPEPSPYDRLIWIVMCAFQEMRWRLSQLKMRRQPLRQ